MEAIVARLKSGGALLLSVEARYGWAASEDAPPGTLDAALSGTGIVDVTGDRWVRTYERDEVVALLENAGLTVERLLPTHYMTDGPLERIMPEDVSLEQLLEAEERCRLHPVWSPLNRAWTAVGIKS